MHVDVFHIRSLLPPFLSAMLNNQPRLTAKTSCQNTSLLLKVKYSRSLVDSADCIMLFTKPETMLFHYERKSKSHLNVGSKIIQKHLLNPSCLAADMLFPRSQHFYDLSLHAVKMFVSWKKCNTHSTYYYVLL